MTQSMQFHRMSGLPSSNQKIVTALSTRRWNAKRLRDLEIMDDLLNILVHNEVPIHTRKAMFHLAQRLLMEYLRREELELISAFLVHQAINTEILSHQQIRMRKAREINPTQTGFFYLFFCFLVFGLCLCV